MKMIFDTFDLLKNLKKARDDLYQKQTEKSLIPQTKSVEVSCDENNPLALEWAKMNYLTQMILSW
jgi:hypothetical protein